MKSKFFVIMLACLLPQLVNATDGFDELFGQEDEPVVEDKRTVSDRKEINPPKPSDYFKFHATLKAKTELGLVDDNDDSTQTDVTISKNNPKFLTSADFFAKLINIKYSNLIFGPTGFIEIIGKMDHREMMKSEKKTKHILFFEEGDFFNYVGVKIGTKFGKSYLAGSSFTFTAPFMVNVIVNDTNDAIDSVSASVPSSTEEFNYYTHIVFGTNLIADLQIRSRPFHFGFDVKNTFRIGGDVCSHSEKDAYKSLFIMSKNEVDFEIKPFNFINNNVDIELKLYFRNLIDFTGDNLELKKRAYFGIKWDGLKYFALSYKPIIYNDESDYQFVDASKYTSFSNFTPYYKKYNFSTEIAVIFGNKYFDIEVAYEPSYYTVDGDAVNTDSVREHKISCTVEVKF